MTPINTTAGTDEKSVVATALVEGLIRGDVAKVRSLFDGPADIDDPHAGRRIDGGFEELVRTWAPATITSVQSVRLEHSTTGADGRFNASEFEFVLDKNGADKLLNAVVLSEFNDNGGLVRNRLYYRLARVTGIQHQRTRILPEEPVHMEAFSPIVGEYQKQLRLGDPHGQAETFSVDGIFNGHGESQDLRDGLGMGLYEGREAVRAVLDEMFAIGDEEAGHEGEEHRGAVLEKLNVFSDGTTTIMEFNIIHENHPVNRVSAGIAAYEIGEDGLIKEARVFDEAW
jgi:hypothetical protein